MCAEDGGGAMIGGIRGRKVELWCYVACILYLIGAVR